MMERKLTPPETWKKQTTEAPNSLQSAHRGAGAGGGRKRHAETKQRAAAERDRDGNGHNHNSRNSSRTARMRVTTQNNAGPPSGNNHRPNNETTQAAKRWVSKLMPPSPGKRKRTTTTNFDQHPLGLPTLDSPGTTHPRSNSKPQRPRQQQQQQQKSQRPQHQQQQHPPHRQPHRQPQRHHQSPSKPLPISRPQQKRYPQPPPPQNKTNTTIRRPASDTNNHQSADNSPNDSETNFITSQKTALQCVDHASRRQAAAKAALTATAQISTSLKDLVGDSNRAVSVARQSRIEAENAAVRAEGAAKKVRDASELVAKDKRRAALELDEANAQAGEAREFLRRVKGTKGSSSPPILSSSNGRGKLDIPLKAKETAFTARIGSVVEVCRDGSDEANSPNDDNSTLSPRKKAGNPLSNNAEPKKQKSDPISEGETQWQNLRKLSQSQQNMPLPPGGSSKLHTLIEPIKKFQGHVSPVTQIAAIDENRFISSSWDTTIRMWDANTGECTRTFRGHSDWVHAVCVLDSKHFISGSDDRTVKMWNVDGGECIRTFTGHSSFVKALASMDGDRFLSGSRDRTIKLFSVTSEECLQTFEGHVDVVSAIVALGSNHFATGSHDHTIKYWDDSSKTCVRTLVGHTGSIKTLAAVSDNEIVSGSDDKMIRLWDVTTGKCLREFGSKNSLVFSVTYICEGFFLSCGGNNIKLYHIPSGACVKSYETPRISLAVVRLDDERFVTGSDQMLHLWKF